MSSISFKVTPAQRNVHRREARRLLPVLVSRHKYTANALLITIIDQLSSALVFRTAVATLVSDTGFSRSTVFEALRYLEDEGMLERTHGPTVNTYRVRVENVWKILADHRPGAPDGAHRPWDSDSAPRRTTVRGTPRPLSGGLGHEGSTGEYVSTPPLTTFVEEEPNPGGVAPGEMELTI